MGRAKYAEDNKEIAEKRLRQRDLRQKYFDVNASRRNPPDKIPHRKNKILVSKRQDACKHTKKSNTDKPLSVFIICKDCGCKFEFDQFEQHVFIHKGWKNPIRCFPCRKKNRERNKSSQKVMDINNRPSVLKQGKKSSARNLGGTTYYQNDTFETRQQNNSREIYNEHNPNRLVELSYVSEVKKRRMFPSGNDAMRSN